VLEVGLVGATDSEGYLHCWKKAQGHYQAGMPDFHRWARAQRD
jgi:hypothetical protein